MGTLGYFEFVKEFTIGFDNRLRAKWESPHLTVEGPNRPDRLFITASPFAALFSPTKNRPEVGFSMP